MATRKPASAAAINRRIDAINRRANPALSEEDAAFVREARARIKELDSLILQAIDARNWSTADRLDVQRGKLWKQVDKLEGRKPRSNNPTRTATLVARKPAAKNPVRATVTDRKKQLPDFRYLVQIEGTGGAGDWFSEAAFRLLSRAEEYAHFLAKKHPLASIRVLARD